MNADPALWSFNPRSSVFICGLSTVDFELDFTRERASPEHKNGDFLPPKNDYHLGLDLDNG